MSTLWAHTGAIGCIVLMLPSMTVGWDTSWEADGKLGNAASASCGELYLVLYTFVTRVRQALPAKLKVRS